MKIMESHDYHKVGEQAQEILRLHGDSLEKNERAYFEVLKRRSETHRKIESLTGLKFDVFNDADPHIAAFITKAGQETHVAEHTLDDPVWAAYAARHEAMHKSTAGFMDMGSNAYLPKQHFDALEECLQTLDVDFEGTDLVEGFNDLLTAKEHGKHQNSGYNHHEVPAAEKLEKLCQAMTGTSLAQAFRSNNVALFHERLERLCEALLIEEAMKNMGTASSHPEKIQLLTPKILERAKTQKPIVHDKNDADRIAKKLLLETLKLEQLGNFFSQPANDIGAADLEIAA